jgi:CRP/FNR family cyclic AMP-dependent transcriptional regulator
MMSRAGVERILAFLGPGAIGGELAIIDGRPRSASVVAVRDTTLKFLSRATFEEFAKKHSEVYRNLVKVLATRLRLTDETVAAGTFLSLEAASRGRCLSRGKLRSKCWTRPRCVHQKIAQTDLAAMTGIARENLSRVFNDWRRRKLVSRLSGCYCLENKTKLKREAEF